MECTVFKTVRNKLLSELEIKNIVFAVLKKNKKNGDISVHIVGDKKIRDLNKNYRGKDKVTDVISFAIAEGESIVEMEEKDFGDIFICLPQIIRQATENNISAREETIRMLVHGVLHILGFDHKKENEAKEMFSLQEKFVKKML
ncbi:MAG: rRNA maturation RNase YbeY [Candidatus Magasanikbacteria bacterium CG10_big_fil_rev_8_21_14_0_10_36_16]|uniref:Endoribonuclease YbeY n=1 Tax=Candidatus Magasanikbacteria bacterium CG10_big_fil_rev_8_21_14_0_10_36_16 TaxID=1974645 RepID=A0A2H0TXZ9_9BACT|nr:MAG: rRNA maturation RNase YbeY [Candidatus Magasanikbacteria bacterium CG10_big_fil_rev_8_21_14_0_10_36_16]